jgi:NAD(P)-dependent dehydrogenase (short-subunit alcohol dehydrogenase family)
MEAGMEISFEGQVAVVTGAGGGIGRMEALELARRGASVVVNDVAGFDHPAGPAADAVVAEIEAAGGTAVASYDSIATPEGGQAVVARALDEYGTVDAVLHFAGTWRHVLYEEMTADKVDPVLDVHLRGGFFVTQPAWSIMKDKGYGRIVLTSSSTGMWGRRWGSNYAAGKAGLLGLGRALALEGAEHGIFTNCLMPVAATENKYRELPPATMMEDFKKSGFESTGKGLVPGSVGERVIPVPTYLASRACTVNGEAFSAVAGRFSRVFVGVTKGWLCDADTYPTAEDFAAHLDEIEDRSEFIAPTSIYDELAAVRDALAERDGTRASGSL